MKNFSAYSIRKAIIKTPSRSVPILTHPIPFVYIVPLFFLDNDLLQSTIICTINHILRSVHVNFHTAVFLTYTSILNRVSTT